MRHIEQRMPERPAYTGDTVYTTVSTRPEAGKPAHSPRGGVRGWLDRVALAYVGERDAAGARRTVAARTAIVAGAETGTVALSSRRVGLREAVPDAVTAVELINDATGRETDPEKLAKRDAATAKTIDWLLESDDEHQKTLAGNLLIITDTIAPNVSTDVFHYRVNQQDAPPQAPNPEDLDHVESLVDTYSRRPESERSSQDLEAGDLAALSTFITNRREALQGNT